MNSALSYLLIILVIAAGIALIGFTTYSFYAESSETGADETETELLPVEEEPVEEEPTEDEEQETPAERGCSDYTTQESCEADSDGVATTTHPDWTVTGCDEEGVTCACVWDVSGEACGLQAFGSKTVDIAVTEFTLTFDECTDDSDSSNASCAVDMKGTLINNGTESIDEEFVVHFVDITNGGVGSLIELFVAETPLAPGEELTFTKEYDELQYGKYFIRFIADPVYQIAEDNEDNNLLSKSINVP